MVERSSLSLALLRFDTLSEETLREKALPVLPANFSAKDRTHEGRRKAFYAGRACLAALLSSENISATIVPNAEFGFLTLSGAASGLPYINISHTDHVAVAALASAPVGIDIEKLLRNISPRVLEKVGTKEEEASLKKVLGNAYQPVFLWSIKEAISKATGLGIKFGMGVFNLTAEGNPPWTVTLGETGPLPLTDPAATCLIWNEYIISVCSQKSCLKVAPTLRVL